MKVVRAGESVRMLGWLVTKFGVYTVVESWLRGEDGLGEYVGQLMEEAAAETGFISAEHDVPMFEWLIGLSKGTAADAADNTLH